jgi:hypothetical protein
VRAHESHDDLHPARGGAAGLRRGAYRRIVWHTVGLLAAVALAWLIMRAYRQPDFIIDLVNMNLC